MWSWTLSAVGLVGLYFAGRKSSIGWLVGLCSQGAWLIYSISTHQWGFLVSTFAYTYVYARNYLLWRRPSK